LFFSFDQLMKIVLGEDRGGKLLNERAFTTDSVVVGRDPANCHFFFEQNKWPMVSRKHAEFRLADGHWIVSDTGSRFGTFLNGQRITGAVEVEVGSHVQLGAEGPILRIISIEQGPAAKPEAKATEIDRAPPAPPKSTPPVPLAANAPAYLELIDPQSGPGRRFELNKDLMRLGRDPEGDVVIDAAAAVVSRRHAEIRRVDNQFAVADLKSFNGTLVNGQRIAGTTNLFDKDQIQLGTGGP
jgi:pSer/pThr/pTyr-binding forkhead associated (FHA) protein